MTWMCMIDYKAIPLKLDLSNQGNKIHQSSEMLHTIKQ